MAKKILTIVGARPQFVKAAVLSRLMDEDSDLHEIMVHTGQHFDASMSDVFFSELGMAPPAYHLNIHSLSHGAMTGRMMEAIETIAVNEKPDIILVYGDTNSTLAGALVGAKLNIPIAHVEAGLRSFNRSMPEEINRILTDHVSTLLLCPTRQAVDHLKDEGIIKGVVHTGDVMFDATLFAKERVRNTTLTEEGLAPQSYALLTLHRQENTDNPTRLQEILNYIKYYADTNNISVLWPVHPRLKDTLTALNVYDFNCIDPVGYHAMQTLLHHCHSVLTDSGGLQKEAYFHQKPCVTLRSETEWVETIHCGWNRLWTVPEYTTPRTVIEDYGQGQSGQKIMACLKDFLNP